MAERNTHFPICLLVFTQMAISAGNFPCQLIHENKFFMREIFSIGIFSYKINDKCSLLRKSSTPVQRWT